MMNDTPAFDQEHDSEGSTDAPAERRYNLHIFCDFDGTISTVDVGYHLFATFGERVEEWEQKMFDREITVAEYWKGVAATLREPMTLERLDDYNRNVPINPGFGSLLDLARAESIPFTIVSDGLDLYIERYLMINGFSGIELFTNHAELTPEGALELSFPYASEGCTCYSVTCKRNILLRRSHPDARIVYIGDGISDYCPAEHADIIFAKGRLAAYCNANRLPHYPFDTLDDVTAGLRRLLSRKRIRPRHQALLKRNGVWESE